jgi:hypothetical protein
MYSACEFQAIWAKFKYIFFLMSIICTLSMPKWGADTRCNFLRCNLSRNGRSPSNRPCNPEFLARQAAAIVAKSRIRFYFWQRLLQLVSALHRVEMSATCRNATCTTREMVVSCRENCTVYSYFKKGCGMFCCIFHTKTEMLYRRSVVNAISERSVCLPEISKIFLVLC